MITRVGALTSLVGAVLALPVLLAGPAPAAGPALPEKAPKEVVHRVVWAHDPFDGNPGFQLRSALPDGTDERTIYESPTGFTLALVHDRQGRRVAFSPCCRGSAPLLVVAPVMGGPAQDPLARHRDRFYYVGGIGWSPNRRRLAFEAGTANGDLATAAIWTVRPNGRDLRRVLELSTWGPGDQPSPGNDALAWTPDGILYSDGKDLRSVRPGRSARSRLVMPRVGSVRVSGDGQTVVVDRYRRGRAETWIAAPDGTDARRILVHGDRAGPSTTTYDDIVPNYDGTQLLAWRSAPAPASGGEAEARIVTWSAGGSPADATPLDFVHHESYVATWN
ncbi:hypothetical protein [Nocardioides sp.]|uniref:TolB family protein n=1 Tax=Nocardioides sp. TaxID=35761 RepID=UPI002BCE7064|nr:hypothetical protein [Nocardioides sp.]HXH77683.1 hypothetical protein [Nocardioides sp.]